MYNNNKHLNETNEVIKYAENEGKRLEIKILKDHLKSISNKFDTMEEMYDRATIDIIHTMEEEPEHWPVILIHSKLHGEPTNKETFAAAKDIFPDSKWIYQSDVYGEDDEDENKHKVKNKNILRWR